MKKSLKSGKISFDITSDNAVAAWVKNDHLAFEILYVYRGVVRKYRPDFLIRMKNGNMLVLETKGQVSEQDKVKHRYLDEWTQAVNTQRLREMARRGCPELRRDSGCAAYT